MAKKNILTKSKIKKAQKFLQDENFHDAIELYKKICETDKVDTESKLVLAQINRHLGFYKEAEVCCKDIVKIKPETAMAWHVLGTVYHYQDNLIEAINCYIKAINIQPNFFESYYLSANAHRELGDLDKAVSLYDKAIKIKPDYLEAIANRGTSLLELNRFDEARGDLNRAILIKPDSVPILCSLTAVMLGYRRPEDALQYILRAEKLDSEFYDVQRLLGSVYKEIGNYDSAIHSYQKILFKNPDDVLAIAANAAIYERQGRYQDAFNLIKSQLDNEIINHSILITFSKLSKKIDVIDNSIELMEDALANSKNNNIAALELHFELGRRYDKAAQFDLSFMHYQSANQITRSIHSDVVNENIIKNYTSNKPEWMPDDQSDFFDKLSVSSSSSEQPIFIVGLLRSGTTLTEQIFSSHCSIEAGGEVFGQQYVNMLLNLEDQVSLDYFNIHNNIKITELDQVADSYLNKITKLPNQAIRVIDSIRTQLDYLSIIARVFPKAHVIYTSREPLDNCLSIYFQDLGASPTLAYTSDLLEIGKYFIRQKNLMAYYKKALNIKIHEVKYESLVTDLEATSKEMIEFCGLDWDEGCLDFHKTERNVITPSYDQVRQPIYTKSMQRWKNYEKDLAPLIELLNNND